MGSDNNPTWKEIKVNAERATVIFHFDKGEFNTQYYPIVKFRGKKNWNGNIRVATWSAKIPPG